MSLLSVVLFVFLHLSTNCSDNVNQIVTRMESLMRGQTSRATYAMTVKTSRFKRNLEMESWSSGTEKAFVRIASPAREKGITFLKIGRDLWQYVPKIERVMKIPPSMMLQSWMGSDFTNDDMVKESSFSTDYNSVLISHDAKEWIVELRAREGAGVIWDKLLLTIPKQYEIPSLIEYFDEEGVLVRRLYHKEYQKLPDRYFPMEWIMESLAGERAGQLTEILVKSIVFDEKIDEELIFSKHALKKLSR